MSTETDQGDEGNYLIVHSVLTLVFVGQCLCICCAGQEKGYLIEGWFYLVVITVLMVEYEDHEDTNGSSEG